MPIRVLPLHPHLGAEVSGVDLRSPVSPDVYNEIQAALDKHAVLVFRGQVIEDEHQLALAKLFGPLAQSYAARMRSAANNKRLKHSEFSDVSNIDEHGEMMAADDPRRIYIIGPRLWHTDKIFHKTPERVTLLSGREVPPEGGDTQFADMRAAWDALPPEAQKKFEGMRLQHNFLHYREQAGQKEHTDDERQRFPTVEQPLVRTNPRTGRKSIYLASFACGVVGWEREAGLKFIEEQMAAATQPQFVYSHKWQLNDLVVWDDSMTMHRATPYPDTKYRRVMHRLGVLETAPLIA